MQKKITNHITNDFPQGTEQHYYGEEREYSYTHLHQMTHNNTVNISNCPHDINSYSQ